MKKNGNEKNITKLLYCPEYLNLEDYLNKDKKKKSKSNTKRGAKK